MTFRAQPVHRFFEQVRVAVSKDHGSARCSEGLPHSEADAGHKRPFHQTAQRAPLHERWLALSTVGECFHFPRVTITFDGESRQRVVDVLNIL